VPINGRGAYIDMPTAGQLIPKGEPSLANALDTKPEWLAFDCYGTLIQWDEELIVAAQKKVALYKYFR
jgi:hypothetical protein